MSHISHHQAPSAGSIDRLLGDRGLFTSYKVVRGYSLVELLTVFAVISILAAASAQLVPSLFRANQVDANVATLSGILEQAREAAISGNTFVWVAFTDNANDTGMWVATIQSQDGTDSAIDQTGTLSAPIWATSGITIPGAPIAGTYLQLPSKIQNLPGVKIVDASALSTATWASKSQMPSATTATPLFEPSGMQWTVSTLQNTGAGAGVYFTHAIEFTPDGEAHVQGSPGTWYANIQFGLTPTKGALTNSQLFNVSRLTGRVTVYRP